MYHFDWVAAQRFCCYDFRVFHHTKAWKEPFQKWSGNFRFTRLIKYGGIIYIDIGAFDIGIVGAVVSAGFIC